MPKYQIVDSTRNFLPPESAVQGDMEQVFDIIEAALEDDGVFEMLEEVFGPYLTPWYFSKDSTGTLYCMTADERVFATWARISPN